MDTPASGGRVRTEDQTVAAAPRVKVVLATMSPPSATKSGTGGDDRFTKYRNCRSFGYNYLLDPWLKPALNIGS